MRRIATPAQLQSEIRRVMALATNGCSRERVATVLTTLAGRVAAGAEKSPSRQAGAALRWVGRKDQDAGDWGTFFEEFTDEFEDAARNADTASTYINIAMKQCSSADHDLRRNSGGGRLGLKGEELNEYVGEQLSRIEDALDVAHKKLRESLSQMENLKSDVAKAKSKSA